MNESRRKPRKLIRLADAMVILQVSRMTLRRMILRGELKPAPVPRLGKAPIKLYEAEVIKVAQDWGIL